MSRQAFEKLLEHLPESDRQRLLRVAAEYGISLDDPAWVGLVAAEQGVTTVQNMLVELHATEQHLIEQLREAEQHLVDWLRAAATLIEARTTLVLEAAAAREQTIAAVAQALAAVSSGGRHRERAPSPCPDAGGRAGDRAGGGGRCRGVRLVEWPGKPGASRGGNQGSIARDRRLGPGFRYAGETPAGAVDTVGGREAKLSPGAAE